MSKGQIKLDKGSEQWKDWRRRCLEPVPGKYSALYFLAANVLGLKDLIPMKPYTHYSLCLFAERATGIPEFDDARIQLIQFPRGTGKTSLVTNARTIQRLLAQDGWRAGIGNEGAQMAKAFLSGIKAQFEENELLRALFPERIWLDPKRNAPKWAADEIILKRDTPSPFPSLLAVGVGGTRTGVHLHEWILDDILSQNLAENAIRGLTTEVDALNRWIQRLPPMLNNPSRDPMTFVCTPWYPGDSYDYVIRFFGGIPDEVEDIWGYIDKHGYVRDWQIKLPDGRRQTTTLRRIGDIAIYKRPAVENGRSIFPERYTVEELEEEAARPGNAWFIEAQYHLNPVGHGSTEFEMEWLGRYTLEHSTSNPGHFVVSFLDTDGKRQTVPKSAFTFLMSIDPAFSKKAGAARTAMPMLGVYEDKIFLFEDFADHGMGTYDIVDLTIDFFIRYQPRKIFIETISAQQALVEPLQREALKRLGQKLPIEEISSQKKAKLVRIYGLEHYFKSGKFYIPQSGAPKFISEYSNFPVGTLRDLLDAVAFQANEWEKLFQMDRRERGGSIQEAAAKRLNAFKNSMSRLRGRRRG